MAKTVSELFDLKLRRLKTIPANFSIDETMKRMLEHPESRSLFVVDENDKLIGIVTADEILKFILTHIDRMYEGAPFLTTGELTSLTKREVSDIMWTQIFLHEDATVRDVIRLMIDDEVDEVPVIDKDGKIIGGISCLDVFASVDILKKER